MISRSRIFRNSVVMAVVALAAVSCSGQRTGGVQIALQVAPGVTLSSADWDIVAPDGTVTKGTVDVGRGSDVPVPVDPLAVGNGYLLIVSGVASNGTTGCSGQTSFDVTDGAPTTVIVHLVCGQSPAKGQLLVTGDFNVCPIIDGVSATPSSAVVGASLALGAVAHDGDNQPGPLTYTWSTTGGALSTTTGASVSLTCTSAGAVVVTVTASDGDASCADQVSWGVTCTEP